MGTAGPDDADLAGERIGAGQTIDLARVGAAHDGQDDLFSQLGILRQVDLIEEHALAGAAAHDDDLDRGKFGHFLSPVNIACCDSVPQAEQPFGR